jgi:V/A-type H+/Na+-transporting ATPase subunit E
MLGRVYRWRHLRRYLTMAFEDLLKSVEDSAEEKEQELRNRAALFIAEIRDRAGKQAETIRKGYIDEADRAVTAERNKLLYLTKAENKEQLIQVRETAFENAFHDAGIRLAGLRSDTMYPAIFKKFLLEATGAAGSGEFTVHVDPGDEALCRKMLSDLKIPGNVSPDITTSGGVIVSLSGDSVVISNTVESRLRRARELRRLEIHTILSGE